ncbi:MAG: Ig-like domain-containing protein [Pirellulales bacterium]
MKSQKASSARKSKSQQLSGKKAARRLRSIEKLEKRDLFTASPWTDGFYYPEIGKATAFLPVGLSSAEYARRSDLAGKSNYSSGGGSRSTGEGADNNPFNTIEAESNNTRSSANFLPLGTDTNNRTVVNVSGTLVVSTLTQVSDVDYYSFDLRGGDIIDVRALAAQVGIGIDLSLQDASGKEVIGNNQPIFTGYPTGSPLFMDGQAGFAVVIPNAGRYTLRVESRTTTNYTLNLRAYRPVLEAEPIGTKQIVYLDFDGGPTSLAPFDLPGTTRFSPLSSFLANWGLQASDESLLIDRIIANVQENFLDLGIKGLNGYAPNTGNPGDYDFVILNSRDHGDPFGLPHVSRIFVGGTIAELGIQTIGLAQSVDVGNFKTEETAVVLLDLLSGPANDPNSVNSFPVSGATRRLDAVANVIGSIVCHEAGHFFGGWHTLNTNASVQLMDAGGVPISVLAGVGPDGIFGTIDDVDVDFGVDTYDPAASLIRFGTEDTINQLAHGLSSGTVGGAVTGKIFNDRNRSGVQDLNEAGLQGWTVWLDLNNDLAISPGEPRTLSAADGAYTIYGAARPTWVRAAPAVGWQPTRPSEAAQSVDITLNQTRSGVNFGFVLPDSTVTGFKWNDLNANGIKDAGEPGLEGIWIYVDVDGDDRLDLGEPATKTLANGSYTLTPPRAGTYAIREVLEPGFLQTYPTSGEHIVSYDGVNPLRGLDFGNRFALDYGDAPAPYPTTATAGGATAGIVSGLSLGTYVDIDGDGQPNAAATGDDINGLANSAGNVIDDEDGITFIRPLVAGDANNAVSAFLTNTTGQTAYLHGWIDLNKDGDWNDAGEQIIKNQPLAAGANTVVFSIPSSATLGSTYARFRLSQEINTLPTGRSVAGEVEDYATTIASTLELAVDDSVTVARNSLNNTLDVLANDFKIPGEALQIVSISSGDKGGNIRINTARTAILYTPRNGFVGRETFTYRMRNASGAEDTATVTVNVALTFENPVAVDDSYDVSTNTIGYPLNVLANDIEGRGGALQIISITTPDQGGSAVIGSGNQSIRYTPRRNFGGTETFSYTATDADGKLTTAKVTVHTLPGDRDDDVAGISFRVTDLSGNQVSAVRQGEKFKVQVYVDDLRAPENFTISPGVFAAYLDMLYNAALVTPSANTTTNSNFNFQIDWGNVYAAGRQGTNEVPGKIDDMGAFTGAQDMDQPDPSLLATITFDAMAPGLVDFIADPADNSPLTDVLLFNTPSTPVPIQQVRYGRASVEIVGDSFSFPYAVDDSLASPLPANSTGNIIDVLDNDSPGTTGSIRMVSVTQPINGFVEIDDNGTSIPSDDVVRYTPNAGYNGFDSFTYTIQDDRGFTSIGRVSLQVGNATGDDLIELRLAATDLNGTPIDQITVGQKFQLRGFVRDLRASGANLGVFAAFQDVLYNSSLVGVDLDSSTGGLGFQVAFSANYSNVKSGDIRVNNLINELGSVQTGSAPLGSGELLQFTLTLTAKAVGQASFVGDPADISPFHDTLLFEPPTTIAPDFIRYVADSINIVAASSGSGEGFTNTNNPFDVNNDGFVSPIDSLLVINSLNRQGTRALGGSGGEGEDGRYFYDVNADGFISPIDALMVLNRLNQQGAGEGEGEVNDVVFDTTADDGVDSILDDLASDVLDQWRKKR